MSSVAVPEVGRARLDVDVVHMSGAIGEAGNGVEQRGTDDVADMQNRDLLQGSMGSGHPDVNGGSLALGHVRGGAELAVVPAQAIPGVSDHIVQAFVGGEAVVFGLGAGEGGVAVEQRRRRSGGRSPPSERTVWNSWLGRGIWISVSVSPDPDGSEPPMHKRLKNSPFLR